MDWQAQYLAGEAPWDEGGPHPALLDAIDSSGAFTGRILVPGCGRGHDVRAVSTAVNRVIGLDIAPAAIEEAARFPRAGLEEYVCADLFELPEAMRSAFDWVIEHTCFCAIEPAMREAYVSAVAGALKPGGRLFGIFYLNPASERQPPYGVTIEELDRLFAPRFVIERQGVPARTFAGREMREMVRVLRSKQNER